MSGPINPSAALSGLPLPRSGQGPRARARGYACRPARSPAPDRERRSESTPRPQDSIRLHAAASASWSLTAGVCPGLMARITPRCGGLKAGPSSEGRADPDVGPAAAYKHIENPQSPQAVFIYCPYSDVSRRYRRRSAADAKAAKNVHNVFSVRIGTAQSFQSGRVAGAVTRSRVAAGGLVRPAAAFLDPLGIRASSAPAARQKAAAFRARGSSGVPSWCRAGCPRPQRAGRRGLRDLAQLDHRGGCRLLVGLVPPGVTLRRAGQLSDDHPIVHLF